MALEGKSLFLYGFEVHDENKSIDFRVASDGGELTAELTTGFYSLSLLLLEVERALEAADPDNVYPCDANRGIDSGLGNRVIINSSSAYFDLLFGSGTSSDTSAYSLLGYAPCDYTGSTFYQNEETIGTFLIPELVGYNFLPPENFTTHEGVVTVAASGEKEAIIFSTQRFIDVAFKYEPEAKVITEWADFWTWSTQIKPFDFTPDYENSPCDVSSVTIERLSGNSSGLGWKMTEMLPNFPFMYQTGLITMRLTPNGND